MVNIIFEAHSTTFDNEAHLSSGHNDVRLSELGRRQAKELGDRYKSSRPDVVFTSDLERAYETARIAFGAGPELIHVDWRLRECNYGDLTQQPSVEVDAAKIDHIVEPFPNGESYEQCTARMNSFLADLLRQFDGQTVMVIGHRATQFGIEHLVNGSKLEDLVQGEFKWQPGWTYELEKLS